MCGIAGLLNHPTADPCDLDMICRSMGVALLHRGPDSSDHWVDAGAGIGFAHQRLAIVDLSPAGRQPMHSACGRYVICYNGEVYNFDALRQTLINAGASFRGSSDTEVILEGFAHWGVPETLSRMIGMFAIALWDRTRRELTLARDRLGIKPLYYCAEDDRFSFASELKALRCLPVFDDRLNISSIKGFVRHNYIGAEQTIYQGVRKLRPGHYLTVAQGGAVSDTAFWSLEDVVTHARETPFDGSDSEAVDALNDLLLDAVGCRMIADVPLGAFLSGGIDSSTVVALMQHQSSAKIKSFSIGFDVDGFNEAEYAKAVAHHLGTDHREYYVTDKEARDVIPMLPKFYDEPFSDSSQIPTYLVSRLARDHVTVVLSGDGGDELFAGYTRYLSTEKFARSLFFQPRWLRGAEAALIRTVAPETWTRLSGLVPARLRPSQAGDKAYKLADVLEIEFEDLYRRLVSHWDRPDAVVRGAAPEPRGIWSDDVARIVPDTIERMQYIDTLTYLPDDILTKVDRASMAVSLEARVPLLDHRVVAFAWGLPKHMKIRDGKGKWLLREVLAKYLPRELVDRPKMGFGVPLSNWLRGPLHDWAQDLLSKEALDAHGIFDYAAVQTKLSEHVSGARNWQYLLWDILMFQAWHDEYMRP